MSYNGSGVFNLYTPGNPVVPGTSIATSWANNTLSDIATGLTTAITRDGQTTTTVRIPFAQGINSSLTTDATSTITGSIITGGGLGVAKAAWIGGLLNVAGATTLQSALTYGGVTLTNAVTGTGKMVLDTGPAIGLANATGLPLTTGITGTLGAANGGTGVANNAANTITFTGAYSLGLTLSGATSLTLPTSGTVATLAGSEELTNKTLNASVGKGTWTASGTWTLPAFTLGGTVSGGGQQLNNIIIGTSTPLAGSFTTLTAGTVGGTLGSLALKGTTSGTATLTVDATVTKVTLDKPFDLGSNSLAAGVTTLSVGATSPILISQVSNSGLISFNNTATAAGMLGMRGLSGGNLVINAPTGAGTYIDVNNVDVVGVTSTGLAVTGELSATSGVTSLTQSLSSGNALWKKGSQNTQAVANSATAIMTAPLNNNGTGVYYVYGWATAASNGFFDIVVGSDSGDTATVLHSTTVYGSPTARTYTWVTNQLKLAMADANTYDINCLAVEGAFPN